MSFHQPIAEFLGKELIKFPLFIFDLWMIVHFSSGVILAYLFKKYYKLKLNENIAVIILLIAYEIFEFLLWGRGFVPEAFVNIFWDLAFGMLGFIIFRKFVFKK